MASLIALVLWLFALQVLASPYDPREVDYNLNTDRDAKQPLQYAGQWEGHNYTKSPDNWRFPFYTLFLDRFVNGDPTNDNINGTLFEHDPLSTLFRHGGDAKGLTDSLDYLQGMGVKGIYIAGTILLSFPWAYDQYSPYDTTVLDHHFATLAQWQSAIDEIHRRGMMSDLLAFDGYPNSSTPFNPKEYKVEYKSERRYHDFSFGNTYNETCEYPRFWNDSGHRVLPGSSENFDKLGPGCYDSDFDQYGDTEAFGVFPDWQRQLSKFASVQDRLREWVPSVRQRIEHFACLIIGQLDIDGFRYDKATQMTPDPIAEMAKAMRTCARNYGKENFFITGEIAGGNNFGSIYLGRGREPEMASKNITEAVLTTNADSERFLREEGLNGFDAVAFHYSIYRTLQRFLGLDGIVSAGYDVPADLVDTWNVMLTTNDMLNANTGKFDPRHMWGASNQDVFRWPAMVGGLDRGLLGLYVVTLHMPGIPLLLWGEEQAFYIMDNTAENYVFGRQAMTSTPAWQMHGCYKLGSSQFINWPLDEGLHGCKDDTAAYDHRDPSHPVRNIIKSMNALRERYPVLRDGFNLQSLSKQTHEVVLPYSGGTPTEYGMWSVVRNQLDVLEAVGNGSVWFVYHNDPLPVNYSFDCTNNDTALLAPFPQGTKVKNLLAPYDEITLQEGPGKKLFIDKSEEANGCVKEMKFGPYGYMAYVPVSAWTAPEPMLTKFIPGHDARLNSSSRVAIELRFSTEMDCDSVTQAISFTSKTDGGATPTIDNTTIACTTMEAADVPTYGAYVPSTWSWKADLIDVADGIHKMTLRDEATTDGIKVTAVDHLLFRIGSRTNPMVWTNAANYTRKAYTKQSGELVFTHDAAGADKFRYSTNFGSSWTNWTDYKGGKTTITELPWSGTKLQKWHGHHIQMQYWSELAGSSSHLQHADADWPENKPPRWYPHLFAQGLYNSFGYDAGLPNYAHQDKDGLSKFHFSAEWPSELQFNVWGMNPDGEPDKTFVFGDVNRDNVLDRMVPQSLAAPMINISTHPAAPYLAYEVQVDSGSLRYTLVPRGSRIVQMLLFGLLWTLPVISASLAIWAYMGFFYKIKFNATGISKKGVAGFFGNFRKRRAGFEQLDNDKDRTVSESLPLTEMKNRSVSDNSVAATLAAAGKNKRRTVLIATIEYDIEDWNIKVKIGGLGVMAQLMGKALGEQDLIWVVPCVGGIDYPIDRMAEPMTVTILEKEYEIQVQYHQLRNITYVLLDAPVFRQQTKAEPYPPRMDDLDSAIYYSAWNQCIAEAVNRFPVDIYHINDYHGAAAPLYLLPRTIPCCLSLHNAEFQGLWPMRGKKEQDEVCKAYNLSREVVQKYVQFGEVFNLIHAAASYLRVHQKGFGAVGVSNKYGPRSWARYPVFWQLKAIGKLPNPDPSDVEPYNKEAEMKQLANIKIDPAYEAARGDLRKQAQEWAGLKVDPEAELFVFVGRWSVQKGIDLIADVFPAVLDKHANVQLICVGPVIDLHGKFAALKLEQIMKKYPGRVYSKPEFTALPPFIFSGAEFALIPSRDEPFGLVAVEFGRKGALGVGARVGGLGQMPGWWFTVESDTSRHMMHQFKAAIEDALSSAHDVRADMRARSAKQRFPVAQWVEDLEILQSASIRIHEKERRSSKVVQRQSGAGLEVLIPPSRNVSQERLSMYEAEDEDTIGPLPTQGESGSSAASGGLNRTLSLGTRAGPGHRPSRLRLLVPHDDGAEDENENMEVPISLEEAEAARQRQTTGILRDFNDLDNVVPRTMARLDEERGRSTRKVTPRISVMDPTPIDPRPMNLSRGGGSQTRSPSPTSGSASPDPGLGLFPLRSANASRSSLLSLDEVTHGRSDYNLQKIELNFTDKTGEYYNKFQSMLEKDLNAKTSESSLAIEDFLKESEKEWAGRYRNAKLGRSPLASRGPSPAPSRSGSSDSSRRSSMSHQDFHASTAYEPSNMEDEFLMKEGYVRPSILKRWLRTRVMDWPIYSIFLAIGQIMAANSYQIVLITGGTHGNETLRIYIVSLIYLVASLVWWFVYRRLKPRFVLSIPFALYGLAFTIIGLAPFIPQGVGRDWARNVATALYATASASGSLYFALNFGDEGGAPIKAWVYRACLIQGFQQIYIVALFYWGRTISEASARGIDARNMYANKPILAVASLPVAAVLFGIGLLLFTSLPPYYRQTPGKIPEFYRSLARRKLIMWFLVSVILQNYFLSAPYGRSWGYLWSSTYAPKWAIALLVLVFFIGVWTLILLICAQLSKSHSWFLPMFAFGLLAPRWAQMWWGTSSYGLWLPWVPGGPVAGALAGRSLWLWLGVLDAVQGVGIGMALLQTLTRIHVAVVLTAAQVLGAAITILAKATSPDRNGPGPVFPDLSAGVVAGLSQPWFWIALACQLVIPVGYFFFFRKEQLSKP
ncbi:unnamed protein product [Zymoseptoria tritici ST99CH_3D1]|nr:unnamed protein product [Zymoseptoria tritici ST99CH_3D1]